jgi:hypothetical protein
VVIIYTDRGIGRVGGIARVVQKKVYSRQAEGGLKGKQICGKEKEERTEREEERGKEESESERA